MANTSLEAIDYYSEPSDGEFTGRIPLAPSGDWADLLPHTSEDFLTKREIKIKINEVLHPKTKLTSK